MSGGFVLAQPLAALQYTTVHCLGRARPAPIEAKHLRNSPPVIARRCPSASSSIADRPRRRSAGALSHLQGAEFLYERSLWPELVTPQARAHDEVAYKASTEAAGPSTPVVPIATLDAAAAEQVDCCPTCPARGVWTSHGVLQAGGAKTMSARPTEAVGHC